MRAHFVPIFTLSQEEGEPNRAFQAPSQESLEAVGAVLSERQWSTVREDQRPGGTILVALRKSLLGFCKVHRDFVI
jgi:hypothetical protein